MLSEAGIDRLKQLLRKATKASKEDTAQAQELRLDRHTLRDIKMLVKGGGAQGARVCWELLQCVLQSGNSKTRLLGLQVLQAIFVRSRAFRAAAYERFRETLYLVAQVPGMSALPPPERAKMMLHQRALRLVSEWSERFGAEHAVLGLTKRFLDAKLERVERTLAPETERREQRARRRRERTQRLLRAQFETVRHEMGQLEGNVALIENSLAELREGSQLLEDLLGQAEPLPRAGAVLAAEAVVGNGAEQDDDEEEDGDDDDDFDVEWSGISAPPTGKAPADHLGPGGDDGDDQDDDVHDDDMAEWEAHEAQQEREEARRADVRESVAHLPSNYTVRVKMAAPAPARAADRNVGELSGDAAATAAPVVQALREAVLESLRAHLPQLQRWSRILSGVEPATASGQHDRGLLFSRALWLKSELQDQVGRAALLCNMELPTTGGRSDLWHMLETGKKGASKATTAKAPQANQPGEQPPRKDTAKRAAATTSPENTASADVPSSKRRRNEDDGQQQPQQQQPQQQQQQQQRRRKARRRIRDPFGAG